MSHYPLPHPGQQPETVVLANGAYPSHAIPLALLANAAYVCCCDGAAQSLMAHGGRPDAIVGDGDSLPQAFKEQHRELLHIVSEQNDNDLTKATRHCLSLGRHTITYLGLTGQREDHTLGNLSLIVRYWHELGVEPTVLTDHGSLVIGSGRCSFDAFAGQQVSIFNLGCKQLQSQGLRWQSYAYQHWWQGTLNEALGNRFELDGDAGYMVFRTYNAKETLK